MRHSDYRRRERLALGYRRGNRRCPVKGLYKRLFKRRREQPVITKVETNIFDKEEIYENCTVQVLTNSKTGEVSVGWWRNDGSGGAPWQSEK